MDDFSINKLYRFGALTASQRVQPVDKISPVAMNLFKETEIESHLDIFEAIDNYIIFGLKQSPTRKNFDKLIAEAFIKYRYAIALKISITTESNFKDFCYKRYNNQEHSVKIRGILITFKGIDLNT